MKKQLIIGTLLLAACNLVACQDSSSSSLSNQDSLSESSVSSSIVDTSSSLSANGDNTASLSANGDNTTSLSSEISSTNNESTSSEASTSSYSSSSNNTSSKPNTYHPIGSPTADIFDFSKSITFALSTDVIDQQTAVNKINNDIVPVSKETPLTKFTSISSTKKESHVTVNRSTSNYSVKDLVEEKHSITKVDYENRWYYSKRVENTNTVYFEEDELMRHTVSEYLYYVDNGVLYYVSAEQSYYEGMEERGTFEAYYYKITDMTEDEYIGRFTILLRNAAFFTETSGINKIDKDLYNNFTHSSSFYYSDSYSDMARQSTYEYHTSNENGNFGCVANDDYTYNFEDLSDYPSMERKELDTITYHQDYLLTISNYFTIEQDYLTTSISKTSNDRVIRDETMQGRKKTSLECDVFYPDLSNFEEREYTPPIIK